MVFWAQRIATQTKAYLDRYWAFQRAFRAASVALLTGDLTVAFPPGAFRPSMFQPEAFGSG